MKTKTHTRHLLAKATVALVVVAFAAPAALAGHTDGVLPPPDAVDRYVGNVLGGVQTLASEEPIPDAVDRYVRNNPSGAQTLPSEEPIPDAVDRYVRNNRGGIATALLRTSDSGSSSMIDDYFRD